MRKLALSGYKKSYPISLSWGTICQIKWNILDYAGYLIYETIVYWNNWKNFREYMDALGKTNRGILPS